jgi:hypothetical protein
MASFSSSYPSPLERQFSKFYHAELRQFAHLHKNNSVCLIGLAPDHPAVIDGVAKVEFGKALENNEAVGKRKRGALGLRVDTPVCKLTTVSGIVYDITALVNVDLVEINHRLNDQPGLVSSDPEGCGFLCIGLTRTESNMERCFPGFLQHSSMMKFIPALDTVEDMQVSPS